MTKKRSKQPFPSNKRVHKEVNYKSNFEVEVAKELDRLKVPVVYEPSKLPYTIEAVYIPDWITLKNGIILEAKGRLDYNTRRKMLAVKKRHPHLDIRFVFMKSSNKISKGSNTTYGDWATKNGFEYCELPIPKKWFK